MTAPAAAVLVTECSPIAASFSCLLTGCSLPLFHQCSALGPMCWSDPFALNLLGWVWEEDRQGLREFLHYCWTENLSPETSAPAGRSHQPPHREVQGGQESQSAHPKSHAALSLAENRNTKSQKQRLKDLEAQILKKLNQDQRIKDPESQSLKINTRFT